ncbi:MAG: apolipoprotein N-acyltransferase [Verrucomicrobiota bacterium]|jgi:apolipoprotein N-acyltransferase
MPPSTNAPRGTQIPLCVDLDGTLIKTDLLWESLARLLRRNPFSLFVVLFWWMRGRAFLKRQLARRVSIDPATLPYNKLFLAFLREQKEAGRKLVLATAFDQKGAILVADHVGLFDEVLGSDGKTNLRGKNKLKALTKKFGERGFDYAGNSSADLAVWRGAREVIVVNSSRWLAGRAAKCARLGPTFNVGYPAFTTLKRFLNELFLRSGYLAAIGAGLLMTAAFPKIGMAGFAWIAPGLMLAIAQGKSRGDAFSIGYAAGLAHFLSSLYWLLLIPATGFPILGWVSLGAYVALYPAVWVWLMSDFELRISNFESWSQRTLWALTGAAVWVALEMVRSRLFGGFPWNLIGVSQFQLTPLIQIASVTGVYGVSFLVVWVSLSLLSAVKTIFRRPTMRFAWLADFILPLFVITAIFAFGSVRLREQNPPTSTLHVTLVQPSIPQTLIWNPTQDEKRFRQLLQLTEKALAKNENQGSEGRVIRVLSPSNQVDEQNGTRIARPSQKTDLLIWPESAVPEFERTGFIAITNLVRAHHIWLIFNAEDAVWRPDAKNKDDYDDFNAAFLFDPDGNCAGIYHKQKLAIFGEYIPLVKWLPFVKYLTPITGSFTPGDKPVTFEMERRSPTRHEPGTDLPNAGSETGAPDRVKTSPLICFEDAFPQLARKCVRDGTDFLVNLTNDGWFGRSAEQWQHMANAVFRAVENGVPLVRCANNGLTCWIDSGGRVREMFKDKAGSVYGVGSMTIELPLSQSVENRTATFYNRHGDLFGWACVAVAVLVLFRSKKNA